MNKKKALIILLILSIIGFLIYFISTHISIDKIDKSYKIPVDDILKDLIKK